MGKIAQSAVLAYSFEDGEPKVLLVTSRRRRRWVLPKGHIEDGQSGRDAAITEAFEEAGINGRVTSSKIGTYSYKKPDAPGKPSYKVKVYPMEVDRMAKKWPEMAERERAWMDIPTAIKSVEEADLKVLLREFGEMLKTIAKKRS